MRLEELHLERFGHFDGLLLDFSGDDIRLHVVYGPNEAGKSTALTAICDALFGIPERTTFDFRHEYSRLRIGATLTSAAGQRLRFKRRKARVNSLLKPDEDGELPADSLDPYLGGASEEFFKRMFALNHQRLRDGGRAMLEAGGDIARSLFEAGAGTAGLAAVVKRLADDADAIGAPTRKAAAKPYWRAHDRYEQAAARMKAEAMKAESWNAARKAAAAAAERLAELEAALTAARREQSALERIRRVAPILRRIDDLDLRLAALGDGVALPVGFIDDWQQAVQAARDADGGAARCAEALAELRAERERLGSAGPWPALAGRIDELVIALGDYRAKRTDLPHRDRDLEAGRDRLAELLRKLGLGIAPERIDEHAPSAPATARIRRLIGEWNRLDVEHRKAREEARQSTAARQQAEMLQAEAGTPVDPGPAAAAYDAAAAMGDTAARLVLARRALAAGEEELAAALAGLGRWSLDADELTRREFPSEESVTRSGQAHDRIEAARRAADDDRKRLTAERRRLDGEIAALRAVGQVPTEDALRTARRHRDDGWRLIRRRHLDGAEVPPEQLAAFAPEGGIAEVYEAAVQQADFIADSREREAGRLERFATLTGQSERTGADLAALEAHERALAEQAADWEREWAALWAASAVEPGSPTEMRGWLARRDRVLARHQARQTAGTQVATAEDEDRAARGHLLRAAAELGLGDAEGLDTPTLRDRVAARIATARETQARALEARRVLADRRRQAEERLAEQARVADALEQWRAEWAREIPALGLPADASAAEAEAALGVWQDIDTLRASLTQTAQRRRDMQAVIAAFEAELAALLAELGDAAADLAGEPDRAAVVPVLQRRLEDARRLETRIADLDDRLGKAAQAHAAAVEQARAAARARDDLRRRHGLDDDADVPALARDAEARRGLAEAGDGLDEAALREAGAAVDMDSAAAEVARLGGEIDRLQRELREAGQALAEADAALRALGGHEGAAAAAQEANDAGAAMIALVEQWLRLRAAGRILNRAVERYREANQHPLVQRASAIFAAVAGTSTGNGGDPIVRLSVDYTDEARPVLVGYRRDGAPCPVAGMSDGTLDQLYLALRIAAIERHIATAEPLPFIADDLFITSDEARTAAGIGALAELGRHTQVLLFTHHQYVVDAATAALAPDALKIHHLRIHSLGSGETAML